METNNIEKIRTEIATYFSQHDLTSNDEERFDSPDNDFYFTANYYRQTDTNRTWLITKVEVYETGTGNCIYEFLRNEEFVSHGWIKKDGISYLLLSEAFQGYSILDLNNRQMYSWALENETFINCEYHPSPDNKKIAILGCYWACPNELIVYDITDILAYPYQELHRQIMTPRGTAKWLDNNTLSIIEEDGSTKTIDLQASS